MKLNKAQSDALRAEMLKRSQARRSQEAPVEEGMNKKELKKFEMLQRMQKKLFDVDTVTRERLIELFDAFAMPDGASGTTGPSRMICGLLQQIATLKGFEPLEWTHYRMQK